MAVNYTFGKAVEIIAKGEDIEAIQDIGKRFPVLMCYASKIVAKAGDDFVVFASKMPEYLTALKVNSALKAEGGDAEDAVEETEGNNDDNKTTDKPADVSKPTKGRRGRPKKVATEDAVEDVEDVAEGGYKSMSAVELFKECEKRGIKTEPKQKASVYIKLLETDDAKNKDVDDDDDWGDDEEDEKSASKSTKATKPAKTTKKETKSEDVDDDDDWDI